MKKIYLTVLLLGVCFYNYAQTTLDFQTGPTGQNLNWADVAGGVFSGYVANPSSTGINTSTTVASVLARSAANGGADFALINAFNYGSITFSASNCIVRMMVYKSTTADVRLKFEGGTTPSQTGEISANYTTANTWQELTFDFTAEIGRTYASLTVLPDFTFAPRPADVTIYFDNISFNNVSTLPLNLISFNANMVNNENLLEWKTASEINFNKFEIEKSVDGKVFNKIGSVVGGKSNYYFKDRNISFSKTSYYRLQMIDNDGSTVTSKIVAVNQITNDNLSLSVYPNPASSDLNINFSTDIASKANIMVYDSTGKLVTNQNHDCQVGSNSIKLNTLNFKSGNYILSLTQDNKVLKTQKFIINN